MTTFWKVILGIAVIAVGSVVLLVFAIRGFVKTVHVQETGAEGQKTVNIDTPFGHVKLHENGQLNPAVVGIPLYPGATRSKDKGGADLQFDAGDFHKDFTVTGAVYFSNDSAEKVRDFYQNKFPSWKTRWDNGEYKLETKDGGNMRMIGIRQEDDHTRIGLASLGAPAAN